MNILTFDIEEWFHILDNASTESYLSWSKYESRIHKNIEIIFNLLSENNIKAHFFIVGWIAEKYPSIVRKIAKNGYKIGSHTHFHQLLYKQSPLEVNEDLKKSIQTIEDLTGEKVESFRAPGFSIKKGNKWVFDILIENGIKYDSSIFPAKRAHGGFTENRIKTPTILSIDGEIIKEFPINTAKIFNKDFVFSGGGYFRITPFFFIDYLTKRSDYVMTYFHPRDFDHSQPIIKELSLVKRFRAYVGLKSCRSKLERWIEKYNFIDLSEAEKSINWDDIRTIKV